MKRHWLGMYMVEVCLLTSLVLLCLAHIIAH